MSVLARPRRGGRDGRSGRDRRAGTTGANPHGGGLVSTGALTLGASIVGAAVNFGIAVVVGRGYGPADTGVFFAVIGVFLVLANALKLGADTGLTRFSSRLRALRREGELADFARVALGPVVLVSLVVAAVAWASAGALGARIAGGSATATAGAPASGAGTAAGTAAEAADLVRRLVPFAPLLALTTVLTAGTRGLGRVASFAVLQNVALPVTRLVGVAVAAALGVGIVGAASWWAAGLPLVALAAAVAYRRALRAALRHPAHDKARAPGASPPRAAWREFWAFSLPRAASALVEIVLEWLDVLLVALLAGEAAAGLYVVATRLVKVSMIVDNALRVTVSTRISAWLATGERARVQGLYEVTTQAMVALIWPFLVVAAVFAEAATGIFGAGFAGAAPVLRVMCLGVGAFAAAGSLQSILLLGGGSTRQLVNKSAALATCVVANLLLTPRFGALGGALAWVSTVLVDTALVAWAVHRHMGIRVATRAATAIGPLVLAAVGTAALVVRWLLGDTLPGLVVGALVGAAALAVALRSSHRLELITEHLREAT